MDQPHPEAGQSKILAEAPHEVCPLWIRELRMFKSVIILTRLDYLLLPECENAVELILLALWGKVREGVDLVRDEVYLVPGADLHQLHGELPAVHGAKGVVGVAVEKPSDLLTQLSLGHDGLLQQGPAERELLAVLLCEAESQMEMFSSVSEHQKTSNSNI